jgi:hypothetical protein
MRQKWIEGLTLVMGFILSACEAQASNHSPQALPQSETAVAAAEITDQSGYQTAPPAVPGSTPTIRPPSGVSACDTANLTASAASVDATEAITFSVQITNQGSATCELQGWPQVQIVDQQGEALVLQDDRFCFECSPPGNPAATPAPGGQPQQPSLTNATAQAILQKPVLLPPGKSARLYLIWRNWCPPFPSDGVNLLMTLSGGSGELTIPTDAHSGGRCTAPTAGSTLAISQFFP